MISKLSITGLQTLLISCLITLILNSCKKEEMFGLDPQPKQRASLLGESRVFFEQNILRQDQRLQAKPKALRHRVAKVPLWEQAEKVQLSIGEGLKVPLAYGEEVNLLIGPKKEEVPLAELTYLLLYKDRQQQWKAEVVTQVPDESYWAHRHESSRSFSGIIIVEDWWGRPVKTFKKTPQQKFMMLSNLVLGARLKEKEPQNLQTPNMDCIVVVTIDEKRMYNVEYTCHEHPGGDGGGSENGEGNGGGFGDGGFGDNGGCGGGNGPRHGDYEEYPRGGGGGRRNDNPPPPPDLERVDYFLPGYDDPKINNINSYLKCFGEPNNPNSNYSIAIYVQEPDNGINNSSGFVNGVGHVCIGLTKDNITQVIGFYPAGGSLSQISNQNVLGILRDNGTGSFNYTISANFEIGKEKFIDAISYLKGFNGSNYTYNLYTKNCTDFVYDVVSKAGIQLPASNAPGPTRRSPGQLGQDLRIQKSNLKGVKDEHGFAPRSSGPCYD